MPDASLCRVFVALSIIDGSYDQKHTHFDSPSWDFVHLLKIFLGAACILITVSAST